MRETISVASSCLAFVFAGATAFALLKWWSIVRRFGTGVAYLTIYRVDNGPLRGSVTVADFPTPPPNVYKYVDVPLESLSIEVAGLGLAMLAVGVFLLKGAHPREADGA